MRNAGLIDLSKVFYVRFRFTWLTHIFGGFVFGMEKKTLAFALSSLVAGGILAFVFRDREFRRSADHILGGMAFGRAVVAGS
jgi:hypothetical protein